MQPSDLNADKGFAVGDRGLWYGADGRGLHTDRGLTIGMGQMVAGYG